MRVFQFIFAICAFATTTSYNNTIHFQCADNKTYEFEVDYPFNIIYKQQIGNSTILINGDFSSDARFFVTTGALAMIYSIGICVVYTLLEDVYKTDARFPYFDFGTTVILALFWLSGTAAWANGVSGLKSSLDPVKIQLQVKSCSIAVSTFTKLTISIILGFLNFFLWTSNLWFVYKETAWFQQRANSATSNGV